MSTGGDMQQLRQQIADIDAAILQGDAIHSRLTRERAPRIAGIKVCDRRRAMRQARPAQEKFQDSVDDALENEHKVLSEADKLLQDSELEVKKRVEELRLARSELSSASTDDPASSTMERSAGL